MVQRLFTSGAERTFILSTSFRPRCSKRKYRSSRCSNFLPHFVFFSRIETHPSNALVRKWFLPILKTHFHSFTYTYARQTISKNHQRSFFILFRFNAIAQRERED